MIKHKDQKQKKVERPIFQNLYNMYYKTDPENWKNPDYEEYLDKTIRYVKPIIDPYAIELDEFTSGIQVIDGGTPVKEKPKIISAGGQIISQTASATTSQDFSRIPSAI